MGRTKTSTFEAGRQSHIAETDRMLDVMTVYLEQRLDTLAAEIRDGHDVEFNRGQRAAYQDILAHVTPGR